MLWWASMVALLSFAANCPAAERDLRLVPFPNSVKLCGAGLQVKPKMAIVVTGGAAIRQVAEDLKRELAIAVGSQCGIESIKTDRLPLLYVAPKPIDEARVRRSLGDPPTPVQTYKLVVTRDFAAVTATSESGLLFGAQTLRQLVRANMSADTIPGVEITDFPSLTYRGFQDDITRGRSSLLGTLQGEVRNSAFFKMNFLTYYMEHQFDFKKHPEIGPKGGSLTAGELKTLVGYARNYDVEIIGCQQSFGHFYHILKHPAYAHLRERTDCLDPTNEETYKLLDDMYSEQMPLLESRLFNVCCDETVELGTGPAKKLAEQIGVGGVYARHMQRVQDLVSGKYGKRMMMWGDIILQHPESLDQIPKDTMMLSWGYHTPESFEPAILPFVKSGFDFFVCPGVSNWNRILPDFNNAIRNIMVYVRDGAKLGAMGMLNTTWGDDGEPFAACNWHGIAWGAECAWNGSRTTIEDFNRRIGAVMYGEKEDHFGQAIALLSKTPYLPGASGMSSARFWQGDWLELPVSRESAVTQAETLLSVVEPAIEHLRIARRQARFNAEQLDYLLFGAERERLIATRMLDLLSAADDYAKAREALPDRARAEKLVRSAAARVAAIRNAHAALKPRYADLWMRENKAYALDRVLARYDGLVKQYDGKIAALDQALAKLKADGDLPAAREVGLEVLELGVRQTKPEAAAKGQLMSDAAWDCPEFAQRIGIIVSAGDFARADLPLEIDLPKGVNASSGVLVEAGDSRRLPCQILNVVGGKRLVCIIHNAIPAGAERSLFLYFDPSKSGAEVGNVRVTKGEGGAIWIENEHVRLLIGREGGHIYRWEVKSLGNRDLTHPGESDWSGFADVIGENRNAINNIEVLSAGPALARVRCTSPNGVCKIFSLWSGVPWVEVAFDSPNSWFANYDDVSIMGAESATPGTFLFSDGATGLVRKLSSSIDCQVRRANVYWGAKFVAGGPMLALITPETACQHIVGPGAAMGGVDFDGGPWAAHFVIYGGSCPKSPKDTLDSLQRALDYRSQPAIEVFAVQGQARPRDTAP